MTTTTTLSAKFADDPNYRARAGRMPSWTTIARPTARLACSECAQLQHETRGRCGARMLPRQRRSFPNQHDAALLLCTTHADAWRQLDREDLR